MAKRREAEGFNLSFLDIMACGLGAAILILMLVRNDPSVMGPLLGDEALQRQVDKKQQELAAIRQETATIEQELPKDSSGLKEKVHAARRQNAALQDEVETLEGQVKKLKEKLSKGQQGQDDKLIETLNIDQEEYLVGLKVEGGHIGILVDYSASMAAEKLRDVVDLKVRAPALRQSSAKWQRTLRTAEWLLARVPKASKLTVVGFSDKAQVLGKKAVLSGGSAEDLQGALRDINRLVPQNGTSLLAALRALKKAAPNVTDIYVITDGLPTLWEGGKINVKGFSGCPSLLGLSSNISGNCRKLLFKATRDEVKFNGGAKVNTVLLPLEGDPEAAAQYWAWSFETRGMTIAPARSWP